jgi:hypothetical protein
MKGRLGRLRSAEEFERLLAEEVSVSAEYGLPLALISLVSPAGWAPEMLGRVVRALRAADLVCHAEPAVLAVALPNTGPQDARTVGDRLRKAAPDARIGITVFRPGDAPQDLLDRAREAGGET